MRRTSWGLRWTEGLARPECVPAPEVALAAVELPLARLVLATVQRFCTPPETLINTPSANKATSAVRRQ